MPNRYIKTAYTKKFILIIILIITTACMAQIEKKEMVRPFNKSTKEIYSSLYKQLNKRRSVNTRLKAKVRLGLCEEGHKKKKLKPC